MFLIGVLLYVVCFGGGFVGVVCCGGGRGVAVSGGIVGVGDDFEKYLFCILIGGIVGIIGVGCCGVC